MDILHTWDTLNVSIITLLLHFYITELHKCLMKGTCQGIASKYKLGNANQRKKHSQVDTELTDLQYQS